ncbi:MAG: hypothetical protein A3F11_05795 [Gammaproteobacteria bacterium RIFCSPHIGHO2_12_FULL_37_14]|nr:MAG: hypothetical protein A3F11_05795 [Gammaproteobacteria bacterium RIFCSPHIGHO2_12_FULL_37_14]
MLFLENVSLYIGKQLLLKDANLKINRGSRIGIVGRNGSGKTHLMEILAGNLPLSGGTRKLRENASVMLVKQELPNNDQSPLEYLRSIDSDIQAIEESLDHMPAEKLSNAYGRLAELDEERYEKLAPRVLMGLGLKEEELNQPMRNLSGGLRMRIALSRVLICTPDILLLDEPTNHLDLESTQWLIEFLKNYPSSSAFVLVTHDIKLMNEVTTTTMHLRAGVLTEFGGNYDIYREQLELKEEQDQHKNAEIDKQVKQKMKIYYQFRDLPEARAAQAIDQLKKAERLKDQKVEIIVDEPVVKFSFGEPAQLQDPIINLDEVSLGYNAKLVLSKLNLSIPCGAKIGLLGRNGEGKTTLIKLLADKISSLSGIAERRARLKVGYFSQELTDELNVSLSVYKQFGDRTGIKNDEQIRSN